MKTGENKFDFKLGNNSAPFNMAINTLERLGDILKEIKEISCDVINPSHLNQIRKLNLIKQFFLQATPLLKAPIIDKYKSILNIKMKECKVISNSFGTASKFRGFSPIFDMDLEIELDMFLLDIQSELQKEGYFMPPKSDIRYAWKQGS